VYDVQVDESDGIRVVMTLTSPMCPVAEILPVEIEAKAREIEGVRDVRIDLVWDPPWNPDMMSEAARLELGM
jgi:metal-sulfur cluster biosynthetic enzyme